MWYYKLTFQNPYTLEFRTFYYDTHELHEALADQEQLGGTITDHNGKQY